MVFPLLLQNQATKEFWKECYPLNWNTSKMNKWTKKYFAPALYKNLLFSCNNCIKAFPHFSENLLDCPSYSVQYTGQFEIHVYPSGAIYVLHYNPTLFSRIYRYGPFFFLSSFIYFLVVTYNRWARWR